MQDKVLSPSDFVALVNQTLEYTYPQVIIEGELANFRVSKNKWVYFSLKDDNANVSFFGSVYSLPGPLEDGLRVRVLGAPRLHPLYNFSVNFSTIVPVGEGSLKKAADLLAKKLAAEGLFDEERKRPLPVLPQRIGLITAANSAAAADFIKILNERWGGVEILLADVLVQGQESPLQLLAALEHFEQLSPLADVIVMTRGGGSAEDLAAFNDERVVRAIAGSRTPTLVAIGHEVDVSLAELAADRRASTPTNAAQLVVPDKKHEIQLLHSRRQDFARQVGQIHDKLNRQLEDRQAELRRGIKNYFEQQRRQLESLKRLSVLFDPRAALKRGYAIVKKGGICIISVSQIKTGDSLLLQLSDGTIKAKAEGLTDVKN